MSKTTDFAFKVLNAIAWSIFVGLSIETGGYLVNTFIVLFINPNRASQFWGGVNLMELYNANQSHFVTITSLLIIVFALKATLFYLIVNIFHKKQLNIANPFNEQLGKHLFNIAYLSFGVGLFSYWGNNFSNWLRMIGQTTISTTIQHIKFEGADVWLFMGVILIIFAMIFKRGIELQSENDLTV
jgi:hypothetical protein